MVKLWLLGVDGIFLCGLGGGKLLADKSVQGLLRTLLSPVDVRTALAAQDPGHYLAGELWPSVNFQGPNTTYSLCYRAPDN